MSTTRAGGSPKVIPARLDFLAIYNPSFGDTDENAHDQILFYHQRRDWDERHGKQIVEGKDGSRSHTLVDQSCEEEQRNERLRQVGLARGMVEFANNFSGGAPVESIETDKTRVVLHELEPGWWVLASIDLTQLPASSKPQGTNSDERGGNDATVEYSSREVSPAPLLLQQLQQAHSMFLLHHTPNLMELYNRLGRDLFCAVLERYWTKFCRDWDVLLHGNAVVDMCNAMKLAGGGELGIGVGEEEWGSGEREVLEDFVRRTEGLLDLVVGRFGDAPVTKPQRMVENSKHKTPQHDTEPWLGLGNCPRASDGIIFSGTGSLARRSLATVSQWIEAIFRHGESAFGIKDNPNSRPRHRRRQQKPGKTAPNGGATKGQGQRLDETHRKARSAGSKALDLRRQAIENAAIPPGIPPPLVGSVERSLEQATANIQKRETGKHSESGETDSSKEQQQQQLDQSSYFDTDNMTKWLKMGYGTSWTLNPKGFAKAEDQDENTSSQTEDDASEQVQSEAPTPELQHMDPTPEVSDIEEESADTFKQRLEQSIGMFLIGLSGDLENAEFEADLDEDENNKEPHQPKGQTRKPQRIFMRTLTVKLAEPGQELSGTESPTGRATNNVTSSSKTTFSQGSREPKTSAAASVDGPAPNVAFAKVQVAVYVHQPFIFVFLFDLQTSNLSIPAFYRNIHHQLGPLQKPLLRSTDPERIPERISQLIGDNIAQNANAQGLYDLVFEPTKLTVRTSIPSIPLPGSLAAEGFTKPSTKGAVSGSWYTLGIPVGSESNLKTSGPSVSNDGLTKSEWTRIDSLNVHTQLLNTWIHARESGEIERTVKTNRGWWVVWLRGLGSPGSTVHSRDPSADRSGRRTRQAEGQKEAFLVRKAVDPVVRGTGSRISATSGKWLMREQRDASGKSDASSQAASGPTSTRGVVEGVGVDVRKWVEAIGRLSQ